MLATILTLSFVANVFLLAAAAAAGRHHEEALHDAYQTRRTLQQAEEELHSALVRQNELTLRCVEAQRQVDQAHRLAMACRHLPVLPAPAGPRKLRPFQAINLN